jgi:hypothetical protein
MHNTIHNWNTELLPKNTNDLSRPAACGMWPHVWSGCPYRIPFGLDILRLYPLLPYLPYYETRPAELTLYLHVVAASTSEDGCSFQPNQFLPDAISRR